MDRLSAVIALVLFGCNVTPPTPPTTTPNRTDAVAAAPKKEVGIADFCESQPKTAFTYPELQAVAPPIERFTWVNVWATWCAPCLEEMPMLRQWDQDFDAKGAPIDLVFLSVDAKPEDLVKFKETHPDMPATLHTKETAVVEPWLVSLGLDGDPSLPLHMMITQDGTLQCVRAGQMGKQYFEVIRAMAAGG